MKCRPDRTTRSGFSMIELLLVVVIIMLMATMAVPSFVKSFRGARLRTSARTVVMIHRHARSTAVLQQKHVAVLFDEEQNQLEVVTLSGGGNANARDGFLEDRGAGVGESEGPASVESGTTRSLEDRAEQQPEFLVADPCVGVVGPDDLGCAGHRAPLPAAPNRDRDRGAAADVAKPSCATCRDERHTALAGHRVVDHSAVGDARQHPAVGLDGADGRQTVLIGKVLPDFVHVGHLRLQSQ